MARNPAELSADNFSMEMRPYFRRISARIKRNILGGMLPDDAVNEAVKALKLEKVMEQLITDSITKTLVKVSGTPPVDPAGLRRWWLNKVWPGDAMRLSEKVNEIGRLKETKTIIKQAMKRGESWTQIARGISDEKLTKGDIAGHLKELADTGRKAIGNPAASGEYRQALARSRVAIEKLAQRGAPTERLKEAYESVIRATESANSEAISKAIDRAVIEKAAYNADRISRTETARAYMQQVYVEAKDDDQVIGIGYDLNDGHPKTDICDLHTGANLYGLGKGRYPLDALPPYPFHPHCICTSYNVYSGDVAPGNVKANGAKYIRSLSADDRRAILGVKGAQEFARNKDSWTATARGYEGHKPIDVLMQPGAVDK